MELVEQYYKDADQYFEFDSKDKPQPPEGGDTTTSTSTDTSGSTDTTNTTTSIQEESKSSDHKNNITKEGVSNDYSSTIKMRINHNRSLMMI